jgi:chorismate mutase
LRNIGTVESETAPGDGDPTLERLRAEIASVDAAIVEAVNRRLELVRRIRHHKQSLGLDFVDRTQEASNLARLEEVNSGPLTSDGLGRLYRELLELTKSETER